MPRERTKQVLTNSGPKSGGVACRHQAGEKLFSEITRKVGDETACQGALQQAPTQPALEQSLGVDHNPVDEWRDTALEGATLLEICVNGFP